jgi:hypothetical protein
LEGRERSFFGEVQTFFVEEDAKNKCVEIRNLVEKERTEAADK